jgi:hypothetical protein
MEVVGVANPTGPPGGLEAVETLFMIGLTVVGVWLLIRRPALVAALVVAVLVWWETGPDAPVWPWVAAAVWAMAHTIGRAIRWLVRGAVR